MIRRRRRGGSCVRRDACGRWARHVEPRIGLARRARDASATVNRTPPAVALRRRRCLTRLARAEQEIEPRLAGLDRSRARRSRHRLDLSRVLGRRLEMMRALLAVGRQRDGVLGLRHDLVRSRDARAQTLDGRGRNLDRRARCRRNRRRQAAAASSLTTSLTGCAGSGATTSAGGASTSMRAGRSAAAWAAAAWAFDWGAFSAAVTRASSVTTADRPISRSPPTTAKAPAKIRVAPRLNSLIGIPNPIKAPPAAASSIPSTSRITDITLTPRPTPP